MIRLLLITLSLLSSSLMAKKSDWVPNYKKGSSKSSKIVQTKKKKPSKKSASISVEQEGLLIAYKKDTKNKKELKVLKNKTLKLGPKSIPVLIKVVKDAQYPDKNRWMAMFLIGRIVGKKSSAFVSKFLKHPNWVLRLASLKTLLALKERSFGGHFSLLLKDKSLLVRSQALENIRTLGLKQYAPDVWKTLFDKNNYTKTKAGAKRTFIIGKAIKTMGDLEFTKVQRPLFQMIQKNKYKGLVPDIEYSLEKMTGKKGPKGTLSAKRHFWKRLAVQGKVI